MTSFDLCNEPWIQVRYVTGGVKEVSLRTAFRESEHIAGIAGEVATQSVAILRLMLAILTRAARPTGRRNDLATWLKWWSDGLPLDAIDGYLVEQRDRFDLRDPERPFMQVAGLATASGKRSGLHKIIADLPDGHPFFTQRAGVGRTRLNAPEAARWLVHCQAFDPSGIKSGAVGDSRQKGGRGYPIGVAWAGQLGLVVVEGLNLRETLLLNLPMDAPVQEDDQPVWERAALGPDIEDGHSEPRGVADLYTWPSRRVLLVWDHDDVVDVQISNGDPLASRNRHGLEPMTAWRRSPNQEKKLGGTVYMPQGHDPARQMWRGLTPILEQPQTGSTHLQPKTLEWLARVQERSRAESDALWRLRVVGVAYGSNASVIDTIVDDALEGHAVALVEPSLISTVLQAVAEADAAVKALADLAANLADATNSDRTVARARARERGYATLDPLFRAWFVALTADTDLSRATSEWASAVRRAMVADGEAICAMVGPGAFIGRNTAPPGQKERHMDAGKAWMFFTRELYQTLSLPDQKPHKEEAL